jgi:hypothetical protein
VVNFRQGLYEEAVIASSAKNGYFPHGNDDQCTPARPKPPAQSQNPKVPTSTRQGFDQDANWSSLKRVANVKQTPRRSTPSLSQGDRPGKENQSSGTNSCREFSLAPLSNLPKCSMSVAEKRAGVQVQFRAPLSNLPRLHFRAQFAIEMRIQANVLAFVPSQSTSTVEDHHEALDDSSGIDADKTSTSANKVSEELLTCLMAIFSQMSTSNSNSQDDERGSSPSASGSCASSSDGACAGDPYGVLELGWRDIGPYKHFRAVDTASLDRDVFAGDTLLARRLK